MMPSERLSTPIARPLHFGSAGSRFTRRAKAHVSSPGSALLSAALVALLGLSSCTEEQAASPRGTGSPEVVIQRLIELSTPLDPTLTSDHHDRQLHAQRALLAELRGASREVGQLALENFLRVEEKADETPNLVRIHLLDVAAHAAPEDTVPLLETLTLEYGHKIDIRTEAMRMLGQVAPERGVELLTPLLKKTKRTSTMPDDEFILRAFVESCKGSGADPVPILVDVASNIYKQDAARHQALQELGNHQDPLAQETLRFMLVESTGNAYLRIKAAQAIKKSFPREQACAIFLEVSQKEADENFLMFLADMIQDNCE